MVRIYGPVSTQSRGGTITLNFYDPTGHLLDYRRVEELASAEGISLRTGCFCNPGAGEIAEDLTEEDMLAGYAQGSAINLQSFLRLMQDRNHKSAGAIRISFGLVTNFEDVLRFLRVRRHGQGPDQPDDRRCQLRYRLVPRHSRRQLA